MSYNTEYIEKVLRSVMKGTLKRILLALFQQQSQTNSSQTHPIAERPNDLPSNDAAKVTIYERKRCFNTQSYWQGNDVASPEFITLSSIGIVREL